jgi:hypothetical protein
MPEDNPRLILLAKKGKLSILKIKARRGKAAPPRFFYNETSYLNSLYQGDE